VFELARRTTTRRREKKEAAHCARGEWKQNKEWKQNERHTHEERRGFEQSNDATVEVLYWFSFFSHKASMHIKIN
ncbi:hypothetical protein A2U01_0016425, partial [Trifolium medium]|nr:hypothetical protein [Trifolium medium]